MDFENIDLKNENSSSNNVIKIIVTILMTMIFIGGAFFYFYTNQLFGCKNFYAEELLEEEVQNNITQTKSIYYYNKDYNPDIFSVHKFNLESPVVSEEISSRGADIINTSSLKQKNRYLFNTEDKVYTLNVESGESEEIFSIGDSEGMITSAVVSLGEDKIVYSMSFSISEEGTRERGEIWIYDRDTKENKKIFEDTVKSLYSSLEVLGWGNNDNHIIFRRRGGDHEGFWGWGFIVDIESSYEVKKVDNISFAEGKLSPDGNFWLFVNCDKTIHAGFEKIGCETGDELKAYNFLTQEVQVVYKNLEHENNTFKSKLRLIYDFAWQDDKNIIFSIPDGIYRLALPMNTISEIYKFHFYDSNEVKSVFLYLATKEFIVFGSSSRYSKFIIDLSNGRVTEMLDFYGIFGG